MEKVEELFRVEALAKRDAPERHGDVLRIDSKWARIVAPALVALVLAAFVFVAVVGVDDYASGPVVIHVDGRRLVTAATTASVESVTVAAGAWVEVDQDLLHLHDEDERAEVTRAEKDFDNQMLRVLRDPSDRAAKESLAALRAKRDQARILADAKIVRAPVAGRVSDVRVNVGQHVQPGDVLVAVMAPGEAKVSAVAMVPASFRPMLEHGSKMRFELEGFTFDYTDVEVEEVSAEAVGPREVARLLGQERGDAVTVDPGAHVIVTARVPLSTFASEGQSYAYFDGLIGTAEIRVRREPILVMLVPALRSLI